MKKLGLRVLLISQLHFSFEVLVLNQFSTQGGSPSVAKLIFLFVVSLIAAKLSDPVTGNFGALSRLV